MSYLVFARKYRPQTFSEILGQDPIVTTLTNAIEMKRIGQAYLFSGPRGTGKTSTARIFAKALNCQKGPTAKPCLKCGTCEEIMQGRSLDVLEIDGASNRGIDQIRALRELAKFLPASGQYKMYIIDEVHQITADGFNALLKILEEPPAHLIFILATTAPHKVPGTILSRCQRYDFKKLSLELIVKKLKAVAGEEKIKIEEEAAIGIARASSGSLRDAESLMDQLAAFSGGKIKAEQVRELLGSLDQDVFVQTLAAIHGKRPKELLELVAQAANNGTDLIQWTVEFLAFLRNVLVAKAGAGPLGYEDLGKEEIEAVEKAAQGLDIEELAMIHPVLIAAVESMRRAGDPRIPLEVGLIRLSTGESVVGVSDLISRLEKLNQEIQRGGGNPPAASAPVSSASAPIAERPRPAVSSASPAAKPEPAQVEPESAAPLALSPSVQRIAAVWAELLSEIHRQKASIAAFLTEGSPVEMVPGDPTEITIGFGRGFEYHRDSLDELASKKVVEEALGKLLSVPVRVRFVVVEKLQKIETAPTQPPAASKNPAGNPAPGDPAWLYSVAELFEGRILPGEG